MDGWTTDRQTDVQKDSWHFTLSSYRTSALWGRCPKRGGTTTKLIFRRFEVDFVLLKWIFFMTRAHHFPIRGVSLSWLDDNISGDSVLLQRRNKT